MIRAKKYPFHLFQLHKDMEVEKKTTVTVQYSIKLIVDVKVGGLLMK